MTAADGTARDLTLDLCGLEFTVRTRGGNTTLGVGKTIGCSTGAVVIDWFWFFEEIQ